MSYSYTKSPVDLGRLKKEIEAKTEIVTVYDHANFSAPDTLEIFFRAALSAPEIAALDDVVADHSGLPLPPEAQNVIVEQAPSFGVPDQFSMRDDATADIVTVSPGGSESVLFKPEANIYSHGGALVVVGEEIGDWTSACVYDADNVIPEEYRAATCEAWPVVFTYVKKRWVPVGAGAPREVDTKPLNSKMPAGLWIRLTYNASSIGSDRMFGVNFFLNKKNF